MVTLSAILSLCLLILFHKLCAIKMGKTENFLVMIFGIITNKMNRRKRKSLMNVELQRKENNKNCKHKLLEIKYSITKTIKQMSIV